MIGKTVKLSWEVHGGGSEHIVLERRENSANSRGTWQRIAELPASETGFTDHPKKGDPVSYRVHAVNSDGKSASSNIVRVPAL